MAKILFIEDDPLILKIYSTRLAADGHEVITAGDGEAGLESAKQHLPDLIVLDIMMPKMDGFTVLAELKKIPELREKPVLVYSNLGREDEMRKAKEMGATESIIKANISPTEMVEKIKGYLGTHAFIPQEHHVSSNSSSQREQNTSTASPVGECSPSSPLPQQQDGNLSQD